MLFIASWILRAVTQRDVITDASKCPDIHRMYNKLIFFFIEQEYFL